MVRIIMRGCNGHMGQTITRLIEADPEIEIVAGVDKYQGIANTYPVFSDIAECDVQADTIIDFCNVVIKRCIKGTWNCITHFCHII